MVEMVRIGDQFGRYLIGRGVGAEIRKKFFSGKPSTWPSVLDFEGVDQATEACIDEIFGALVSVHGLGAVRKVTIKSAIPAVQEKIEYVFEILREPPTCSNAEAVQGLLAASRRRTKASPSGSTSRRLRK